MSYSIGTGSQLPLIQPGSTAQSISAIGDAYRNMNASLDKIAAVPALMENTIRNNADARYSAALNRYSNDPEGLAKALANGEIDTTDVRAETLNQTQDRLKDIGLNKTLTYAQRTQEDADNWFNTHPELVTKYQSAVQRGDNKATDAILAEVLPTSINSAAYKAWFTDNPFTQKNKDKEFALESQRIATQGLALQKYADEVAMNKAISALTAELVHENYGTSKEGALTASPAEMLNIMYLDDAGAKNFHGRDVTKIRNLLKQVTALGGSSYLYTMFDNLHKWGTDFSGDGSTNIYPYLERVKQHVNPNPGALSEAGQLNQKSPDDLITNFLVFKKNNM